MYGSQNKQKILPYTALRDLFLLGAFAKLRKVTISFVVSVCPSARPSARMDQLGSYWKDFYEIWYLSIFRKAVKEIEV
jgi:hypothetical protein